MIGVIGLGGAGGNIAEEAEKRGFLAGAINFSQKDLDAIHVKHKLRLSGSEGVGKNRDVAVNLFQDQWEIGLRFIEDYFSNMSVLIFAFASSGGSGSGIAPVLMEVVANAMSQQSIVAMPILPDYSESVVNQMNCLSTFDELSDIPMMILPIDNQQARKKFRSKVRAFEHTNKISIDLISKLYEYTNQSSKMGNFDLKDFLTVMSTTGLATISEVELMQVRSEMRLDSEWMSQRIYQEVAEGSLFAPIEEGSSLKRAAIIFDGQESVMDVLDYNEIFKHFKYPPVDLFEGYYQNSNGKLLILLAGLPWCNQRLAGIQKSLKINEDTVRSAYVSHDRQQFKPKHEDVSMLRKIKSEETVRKQSVSDILSKYKR